MSKNSFSHSYRQAGVDIEAGYKSVDLIKKHVQRTVPSNMQNKIGGFGGMMELDLNGISNPVLISGTDGVGTKLKLAFKLNKHDTVGIDCVAMCVNDIICAGAKPLYFLDYIALGKNIPKRVEKIVKGIADGLVESGAALIGGETAEMPGMYAEDEYDLAGFATGIVDRDKMITGANICEGDIVIGIPSSGIHSNGFSLIRKIFDINTEDLLSPIEELDNKGLGEVLLTPTKIYVKPVLKLISSIDIKGLAHITGGGFYENIPRILPNGLSCHIQAWKIPKQGIFSLIERKGNIPRRDMYNTFNMGIGMIAIVNPKDALSALDILEDCGFKSYIIGEIKTGEDGVVIEE